MKKLMFAVLAIAIVVTSGTFMSCKKGENDPFLSLRSRKARLVGEWTLKEGTVTETYSIGSNSGTITRTYTEAEMTWDADGSTSVERIDTYKWAFEKDGQFEFLVSTTPTSSNGVTIADPVTYTTTTKGVWAFLGANKDQEIKNREAVLLRTTSQELTSTNGTLGTVSYTGVSDGDIIMLDQLKNKELIFNIERSTTDSDGDVTTSVQNFTFVQD